jgi:hypothetical protein
VVSCRLLLLFKSALLNKMSLTTSTFPTFKLGGKRFDDSVFYGRLRNTLNQYDVTKMMYSTKDLEEAKALLEVRGQQCRASYCVIVHYSTILIICLLLIYCFSFHGKFI